MKKAVLIFLLLILVSIASLAQTSLKGKVFSVRDYGAKGDGVTSDQTAVAAAISAAAVAGGTVWFPDGTYLVTGLTMADNITLLGNGKMRSVIKSSTNAPILNCNVSCSKLIIQNLNVQGSDNAAHTSQVGINLAGASVANIELLSVYIEDTGSTGLYIGSNANPLFTNTFNEVEVDNPKNGLAIDYDTPGPASTFRELYIHTVGTNGVGMRVRRGTLSCQACNGIDGAATGTTWVIVGQESGVGGDTTTSAAVFTLHDSNLESWKSYGIQVRGGSIVNLTGGTTFSGDGTTGCACLIPISYTASSSTSRPGVIDPTVTFGNSTDSTVYVHSKEIESAGAPPLILVSPVGKFGGFDGVTTYYDTTASAVRPLRRLDAYQVATVTGTATVAGSTVQWIQINNGGGAGQTVTIPWAGNYASGAVLVVKDIAGNAGTNAITINASSGSQIDGAGSVSLNQNYGAFYLISNATNWFTIGTSNLIPAGAVAGTGVNQRVTIWSGTSTVTSDSDLTFDGTNLTSGRVYASAGSGGAPSFAPSGDNATGFFTVSSGKLGFASSATPGETLRLQSNGLLMLGNRVTWDAGETIFDLTGSGTPEGSVTGAVGSIYRRTNGASGTTLYVKESGSGNTGWTPITSGAAAPLTATYIGYGDGSNILTGTSSLTWNNTTRTLTATSAAAGIINLSTASTNSAFQLNGATHPGTAGGFILPFVGGTNGDAPGLWWTSSASYSTTSGLFLSNGFNFQGATSTHDPVKINAATSSSSSGTTRYTFAPSSSLFTQNLSTASTGATHDAMQTDLTSSGGAGGTNLGIGHLFRIENASSSLADASRLTVAWATATAGSETGRFTVSNNNAGGGIGESFGVQGDQFYGTYYDQGNVSGAVTWNMNNGNFIKVTVTGNITSDTWNNLKAGARYVFMFQQDGVGGRTWTPGTEFKYPGGVSGNVLTATIGAIDVFICDSDGANLYCNGLFDVKNP